MIKFAMTATINSEFDDRDTRNKIVRSLYQIINHVNEDRENRGRIVVPGRIIDYSITRRMSVKPDARAKKDEEKVGEPVAGTSSYEKSVAQPEGEL